MSAKYINPALPSMIRGLYRADLREKSIQNMLDLAADIVQELIDLRAALAEQGETEWEYGYELIEPDTREVFERDGHYTSTAFAYRAAKMRIREERYPGVPDLQYSLIQRTKAGPWLPVPGSTVRESDSGVRDSDNEESEGE